MATTTSAYRLDAFPLYEPAPREDAQRRADVRAVRTSSESASDSTAQLLVTAAKLAAFVLVVVAVLSFVRIALTNAAVATLIESDTLSAQIEEARASGVSLEMEQSVLTSPTSLKSAVKRLGMSAPAEVGTIVLDPDVVVLDEEGSLSLSASLKNAVQAQG